MSALSGCHPGKVPRARMGSSLQASDLYLERLLASAFPMHPDFTGILGGAPWGA